MKLRLMEMIPVYSRLPLLILIVWNFLVYYGGRLIAGGLHHYSFALPWDSAIPQIPWTVLIYFLCFLFWFANYLLAARRDEAEAYRFFCADFLMKLVCLLCFVFLPTTMLRPEVSGDGIWCWMLNFLYHVDAADNLFPSLHCAASILAALGIHDDKRIPRWYRIISWFFAAAICASTLTTKQHMLVDALSGILLAFAAYRFAGISKISEIYRRLVERCMGLLSAVIRSTMKTRK